MHKRHAVNIKKAHSMSDRVLFVDLRTDKGLVRIIAAYAPHGGYSQEDLLICL